jgi:hypothetical protein
MEDDSSEEFHVDNDHAHGVDGHGGNQSNETNTNRSPCSASTFSPSPRNSSTNNVTVLLLLIIFQSRKNERHPQERHHLHHNIQCSKIDIPATPAFNTPSFQTQYC